MNSPFPAPEAGQRRNWTRYLVNVVVALAVIAVAAATFVFSYDGVHAVALLGGMSPRLARYYPGLFDAVLVIACVAAIMLRDGRWWGRLWAWLVFIVVLAAIGATDVLHAAGYTLRHRPTEGVVAGAPVVAVLLAVSLLVTLLRQPRTRPAVAAAASQRPEPARATVAAPPEVHALPAAVTIALPAAPAAASEPTASEQTAETAPAAAREELVTDDGPVPERPVLERPVPERPVLDAAVPDRPVLDPAVPDRPGLDPAVPERPELNGAVTSNIADASPVTPPDGLPVLRLPATEPGEVLTPAEAAPPDPVTAEQAAPEAVEQAAPPSATEAADEPAPEIAGEPVAEQVAEPAGEPVAEPAVTRPGIRYAGGGVTGRTGRPLAAEPEPEPSATAAQARDDSGDYWDGEDADQYAGLVYSAGTDSTQPAEGAEGAEGAANDADGGPDDDATASEPLARRTPQSFDRDAPAFASAPFAPPPRLNRVRSMPAPPADDEDE
jgi:Protein of unknown function (DUF2637)